MQILIKLLFHALVILHKQRLPFLLIHCKHGAHLISGFGYWPASTVIFVWILEASIVLLESRHDPSISWFPERDNDDLPITPHFSSGISLLNRILHVLEQGRLPSVLISSHAVRHEIEHIKIGNTLYSSASHRIQLEGCWQSWNRYPEMSYLGRC